eukprot:797054-Pelagomonas_calceolata.AAC.1
MKRKAREAGASPKPAGLAGAPRQMRITDKLLSSLKDKRGQGQQPARDAGNFRQKEQTSS